VGRDHALYLVVEKGELGIAVLRDALARFDPDGLMNPGVLLGDSPALSAPQAGTPLAGPPPAPTTSAEDAGTG
jgi:hypothetical protein